MYIKTGNYLIRYYNAYGAHLKLLDQTAPALTEAKDMAIELVKSVGDISSFTIVRVVHNSLDADVWGETVIPPAEPVRI